MRRKAVVCFSLIILLGIYFQYITSAHGASGCEQANWGFPLAGEPIVNSPFNKTKKHYGTDYKAADGDGVFSVSDGKIEKIGFDSRQETNRLGLKITGWGRYVVVKHSDGSSTLYAHLLKDSTNHLSEGLSVTKGIKIGEADSTGGVSGPHLHLEYAPDGNWRSKSSKKDPNPCVLGCNPEDILTLTGSEEITRNSTKQYTATGCPSKVTWGISGTGAITSTGLFITGSEACGTITITASCEQCGTSATKEVRVTDAGSWYWIQNSYCGVVDYSCYSCPGYYHNCGIAGNIEIIGVERWIMEWFIVPVESPCSCIATDYQGNNCSPILPFTPEPNSSGSGYGSGYGDSWKTCEIIYQQWKERWVCSN